MSTNEIATQTCREPVHIAGEHDAFDEPCGNPLPCPTHRTLTDQAAGDRAGIAFQVAANRAAMGLDADVKVTPQQQTNEAWVGQFNRGVFLYADASVDDLRVAVRAAERLADEVAALVQRGAISSRSPAADALLDFRNPPSSPRADRIAELERALAAAEVERDAAQNEIEAFKQLDRVKSPFCDHLALYAWTDNGGKTIWCLLCVRERLTADNAALIAERDALQSQVREAEKERDDEKRQHAETLRQRGITEFTLIVERDKLREIANDVLCRIERSHKASIGSINNTYTPQIGVEEVEAWRAKMEKSSK
jgi:hypothetical protein